MVHIVLAVLLQLIDLLDATVFTDLAKRPLDLQISIESLTDHSQYSQNHKMISQIPNNISIVELNNAEGRNYIYNDKNVLRGKRTPQIVELVNATDETDNVTVEMANTTFEPEYFATVGLAKDYEGVPYKNLQDVSYFLPDRPIPERPLVKGLPSNDTKYDEDCLADERIRLRPYPNVCYKSTNATNGTKKILRNDNLWRPRESMDEWKYRHRYGYLQYGYLRKNKNNVTQNGTNANGTTELPPEEQERQKNFEAKLAKLPAAQKKAEEDAIQKFKDEEAKRAKNSWDHVWSEIRNDFAYTFDFVLWDNEYTHRKETQFWYLILYLKTLALHINLPQNILVHQELGEATTQKLKFLTNLIRRKRYIEDKTRRLEAAINKILAAMKRFEYDKTTLLQQLDVLNTNIALYEGDKAAMESRVEDIRLQTELVTNLIKKFMPVVYNSISVAEWVPHGPVQEVKDVKFANNYLQTVNS